MPGSNMESDYLPQTALLWEATGTIDDYGVKKISSTSVEISVRWLTTDNESSGPQAEPIAKRPDVTVDRDIAIGSILWLGGYIDISGTAEPLVPPGNFKQVISFKKVPDLKGRNFHRSVGLMHFGNNLPPTV